MPVQASYRGTGSYNRAPNRASRDTKPYIVKQIDEVYSNYREYWFAINDSFQYLHVQIPSADSFYDVDLPHTFTISGILTSVDSPYIYLKDVFFYDDNKKQYVGSRMPTYNTKTYFSENVTSASNDSQSDQTLFDSEPSYKYTGYLTNGTKKYNIEMALYEQGNGDYIGYYRYTNQPADKIIKLHGSVENGVGLLENTQIARLYTEEETERFEIYIEQKEISGHWYKYSNAEDCVNAENNYTSLLEVVLK